MTRIPDPSLGTPAAVLSSTPVNAVPTPSHDGGRIATQLNAPPVPATRRMPPGGGLPVEVLNHALDASTRALVTLEAGSAPQTPTALAEHYAFLGHAQATAEAVLLSSLDALDARTGGGVGQPAAAYQQLRRRAFALLRQVGLAFDRTEPAFAKLVHDNGGWPTQSIVVTADRGDGKPLRHYVNTYKKPPGLTDDQRLAEHDERVTNFAAKGGHFDNIITADSETFAGLNDRLRYDYVMQADGTLRMHPNAPDGHGRDVKPGHSLLATGGPEFVDAPVLLAGELWVYKDSAGDVEAVVLANNSGHFKPEYADLENALPLLELLGLPRELVVVFGGPNNLPSLFEEISENCNVTLPEGLVPPTPEQILDELGAGCRATDSIALRTRPRS